METVSAGLLQPLLDDPEVTDVLVSDAQVWVDRGGGLVQVRLELGGEESVRALAVRLAASAGRRLDAAAPFVDAAIGPGVRLHAVLPPIASDGTCLSLRILRSSAQGLAELLGSAGLAGVARSVVRSRLASAVTGATGVGKTTVLAALLSCADPGERLVLVEDAGELRPVHPHVVRLQARLPNVEGVGAISLRQLVREALRMRPDRLVVGEVRGPEIADLLLAMNTGHDGGATTLHANGPAELPARLEALGALAGMSRDTVTSQVLAGLRVVLHLERTGVRRGLQSVCLLDRSGSGDLVATAALTVSAGQVRAGPAAGRLHTLLAARGHPPW